jgi:hypothetical protein
MIQFSLLIIIYIYNVFAQMNGGGSGSSGCFLMFVTSMDFSANLGGIEGADLKCTNVFSWIEIYALSFLNVWLIGQEAARQATLKSIQDPIVLGTVYCSAFHVRERFILFYFIYDSIPIELLFQLYK